MASKRNSSEAETLLLYQTSIENAQKSEVIAEKLAAQGYDAKKMAEAKQLYEVTDQAYFECSSEKHKLNSAHKKFTSLKEETNNSYYKHRKLAKVVFRKDQDTCDKLGINALVPKDYNNWLRLIEKFYTEALDSPEILKRLSELMLTGEVLSAELKNITRMEAARLRYIKKKGESQNATKKKNEAFDEIYEWMKDFYAVAKIVLKDTPDYMVSLGKELKRI